jgi:hypothetical protein
MTARRMGRLRHREFSHNFTIQRIRRSLKARQGSCAR